MWHIEYENNVKIWSEKKVRRKLRAKELTGLELVRKEGSDQWMPLHQTELFALTVPISDSPELTARRRRRTGLIIHMVVFSGVSIAMGFPFWIAFWAIGLAVHAIKVQAELSRDKRRMTSTEIFSAPQTSHKHDVSENNTPAQSAHDSPAAREPEQTVTATEDPILGQFREALAESGIDATTQQELLEELKLLREKTRALQEIAQPELLAQLTRNAEDARQQASEMDDIRTKEIFTEEAVAIELRIANLREVTTLLLRLQSKQRTLLHQLEGLRLGALTHDAPEVPDFKDQVTRLRKELIASDEVEQTLARHRMAHKNAGK